MNRAAILIGVRDTGGLPRLQTVFDGVAKMEDWAKKQGLPDESITILTDEQRQVSAVDVLTAVKHFTEQLTYEQLIIYYTGHGMNLGQSEFWLLSDAPGDATTIINLSGTMERARTGPIPHVVFISDACRTSARSVADQISLGSGMPVFPNPEAANIGNTFKSVDVFYATVLGRPSLEIRDADSPEGLFRGIYTEALVDGLNGLPPIEPEPDSGSDKGVIRPWPLRDYLDTELPRRLLKQFPANPPSQIPDAVISSNPSSWLSAISISRSGPPLMGGSQPPDVLGSRSVSLSRFSQSALRGALDPQSFDINSVLRQAASGSGGENEATRSFEASVITTSQPFDRSSFETMCGFQVHGGQIIEAISTTADVEILTDEVAACRVALKAGAHFASVLLIFDNEKSVILPAIDEFLTGLRFDPDGHELIDVSYEPSEFSSRWTAFQQRQDKLRSLRAIIAASSRMGTFQLEGENDAEKVARDMQIQKGVDPSLAIYAAYAYRRQGNPHRLEQMYRYHRNDLGLAFFDVAMLAGKLPADQQERGQWISPPAPMLSQGWAMLDAFDIRLPEGLEELGRHVDINSLWTIYDAEGTTLLKDFILADGR